MKLISQQLRLSATDLSNHLACHHLSVLDLAVARGTRKAPEWKSPDLAIKQQLGLEHEEAYLRYLEKLAFVVKNLRGEPDGKAIDETLLLMKQGADVIAYSSGSPRKRQVVRPPRCVAQDFRAKQVACVQVDCGELEISEIPRGSCPLQVHVRRRYGANVQLGEITRWEDRNLPAASPVFNRGGNVYHATFSKPGSAETRSLRVYASADGANSFLLETSAGERVVADNVEISRRFMLFEIGYRAAGFNRSGSGTGGSPHHLFIW